MTDSYTNVNDNNNSIVDRLVSPFMEIDNNTIHQDEYDENVALLLTITECDEYANFLIGQDALWAFTSEKPEDRNHMIRFWFTRDNFIIYRLSDEEIKRVVEQVGDEVYIEELEG